MQHRSSLQTAPPMRYAEAEYLLHKRFLANKAPKEEGVKEEIKEKERKIEGISTEIKEISVELLGERLKEKEVMIKHLERALTDLREDKARLVGSSPPGVSVPTFQWKPTQEDFPHDGPGKVVFQRKRSLVQQEVDFILETKAGGIERNSHYYRGAPGSGKSVFLAMLGKELQDRGCSVFHIKNAKKLDLFPEAAYERLIEPEKDTVVLLVDEVHKAADAGSFTDLLRTWKYRIIVIGVGIKRVGVPDPSPDFNFKHEPHELLLDKTDIPQLVKHWSGKGEKGGLANEAVEAVCKWLLNFTGGHIYPFTQLAEYLFNQNQVALTIKDVSEHIQSHKFSTHNVMGRINARCFEGATDLSMIKCARRVILGDAYRSADGLDLEVQQLESFAFWDSKTKWFISDLLLGRFFNLVAAADISLNQGKMMLIDEKVDWEKTAEDIVIHGLRDMGRQEFVETRGFRGENGMGILWGYKLKCAYENIYVSPQTKVSEDGRATVDWYFDSRLDMAVELIKNGRPGGFQGKHGLNSKFEKFEEGGLYSQFKRYIILNFEVEEKSVTLPTIEQYKLDRLYTFVYKTNKLYRGEECIREHVVSALEGVPDTNYFHGQKEIDG